MTIKELESLLTLMAKHNVTEIVFNGTEVTMAKPQPQPLEEQADPLDFVFQEPQRPLDELYEMTRPSIKKQ